MLSRLARERAVADAEEGRWLLCALRSAVHVHVGCGSFSEYIERLFGYKPRTTQEKLRVAEALEALPNTARELESGVLSWCAARELTRVAAADTERAWLDAARGKTIRQLEQLVANRSPGDGPTTPPRDVPRPRVLRFDVAPETFALFREAMQQVRRAAGEAWDDDSVLLSMARHVLGGPGGEGRSSYQVSLTVCEACSSGAQLAGGELVPVGDAVVAMAECDAQLLGQLLPRAANQNASKADAADGAAGPCGDDSGPCRRGDAHVGAAGDRDVDVDVEPTVDAPARAAKLGVPAHPRAKQNVPPAVRRAVLARDQHRCRVPGCTHATFVDVHHVRPRAEGGGHKPDNLITVCSAHHRASHRGELIIKREDSGVLSFRHADGTDYGHAVTPRVIDVHTKVFSGLRNLGFREREIRAVLAELLADDELRDATPGRLLREALCRIRPGR
jgi:hypothetical protein